VFLGSVAVNDPKLGRRLRAMSEDAGWAVSPDDAYQGLRGLRTLTTRLERHGASALQVARWLADQPGVARVLHPALPGCPGHEIWARDFTGACGLFAVVLEPATQAAVNVLLDALELFGLGFSWGGFESLAVYSDPQLARRAFPAQFEGPLLRLHIGLEDPTDLTADLERGLAALHDTR
jgi:cystathionine beta-lyase